MFTRLSDKMVLPVNGSDNQYDNIYASPMDPIEYRSISVPLLASRSYQVTFAPPVWNPTFYPRQVSVSMQDAGEKGAQSVIRSSNYSL